MQDPKTILPAVALVSLFKDTLVLPEKEIKSIENEVKAAITAKGKQDLAITSSNEAVNEEQSATPIPIKYLGDHVKKIIVIVHDIEAVYLNETDLLYEIENI